MTHNVDDAAHAKHVILRAQLGHGGMWAIYIKRGRENQFLERTFSPPNLLSPAMRARVHAHARARANALQDQLLPAPSKAPRGASETCFGHDGRTRPWATIRWPLQGRGHSVIEMCTTSEAFTPAEL